MNMIVGDNMNRILDLFYNEILKETAKGRVDCNMMYNILFKTKINGKTIYSLDSNIVKNNNLLIPTLIIEDVNKFNDSLISYYNKAKEFYKDKINKEDNFDKTIITLLWNNLTEDDFKNPVNYINRYIDFMNNPIILNNDYVNIGYSNILDSNIEICLKQEPINEETPYGLYIRSKKENLYYEFPVVRIGISKDKAYIYAVQQKKNKELENEENYNYEKYIHRKLFKVNAGFIKEENADNIINPENITGISPSALISLTITLSILESSGIKKIEVPTFLPVRYNAKEISYMIKKDLLEEKGDEIFANADSVVLEVDLDKEIVKKAFQLAEKHNKKIYSIVSNMTIAAQRRDFIQRFDCFICNQLEAGILFADDYSEKNAEELQEIIAEKVVRAHIPAMIVTMGGDGAVYADIHGNKGHVPARKVNVIDTTGAGDAFCSGVVAGLTYGKTLPEAVEIGSYLAASVITTSDNVCPRFLPSELGLDVEVTD